MEITNGLGEEIFELTPEQWSVVRKTGQSVFGHRCDWARYYLKDTGLIESPKTGYSKITNRGLAMLEAWNENPKEIEDAVLQSPAKFLDYINERWPIESEDDSHETPEESIESEDDSNQTPEELFNYDQDSDRVPEESIEENIRQITTEAAYNHSQDSIEENYQSIRGKLAKDLLRRIKENSPIFFEELVIDLLVEMGYGGSREDAQAVGRSGDGGIDGVIKEGRLGLDVIYVQAKRWASNVGEPPVRDFVGALQGKRARKGIFITTSEFSNSARKYISAIDSRDSKVILIDGHQLAQLMIDHDVGVSVEKIYEIKRVDSDYFAEDTENS